MKNSIIFYIKINIYVKKIIKLILIESKKHIYN